jgi:hypothetical protein
MSYRLAAYRTTVRACPCAVRCLSIPSSAMSPLRRLPGDAPGPSQRPFSLGMALSAGLWVPLALSAGSVRFLDPYSPAGAVGLCSHWLTGPLDHGPDPIGVVMFHTVEMRPGGVPSVLRGLVPLMRCRWGRILATWGRSKWSWPNSRRLCQLSSDDCS